jgi:uncharacterized protein YecT (DUF1311 family)
MPDEFSPSLGGLESDYRIETELRHEQRSRTVLARHLGLNRDVSIQVLGVPGDESDNSLTLFASDARTLSVIRHPNVVPVIEARWLPDGSFAVVRPRVRGPVIHDVLDADGPLAASRVASVLSQVASAIAWARDNGIVHRGLSADGVRFQQGSGRVLVEMDFSPLGTGGGVPDEYDDARTIGRLAQEMLFGRGAADAKDAKDASVAALRTDLSPRVIAELSAVANADRRGAVPDPHTLIALLAAVPDSSFVPRPPRRQTPSRGAASASKRGDTPVAGRMGFGARLVILAVISTAVGAAGALVFRREAPPSAPRPRTTERETTNSAGEIARARRAPLTTDSHPSVPAKTATGDSLRPAPPATRRHEPLRGAPPATLPGPASASDLCESSNDADQRRCLANSIERGDRVMNIVYQHLIATLRRQAKAAPADPDPAAVTQIEAAQHDWLNARAIECRKAGEPPFYADVRAACYADRADQRMRDLQAMLDSTATKG